MGVRNGLKHMEEKGTYEESNRREKQVRQRRNGEETEEGRKEKVKRGRI